MRARGIVAICAAVGCQSGAARPFPPPVPDLVAANEATGDPHGGRFPFEDAIADLPGEGGLEAVLVTDEGTIECVLEPAHAPLTVANFVGLARGVRPFQEQDGGPWVKARYYDGVPWHRAIEGQFIQTGRRQREDIGFSIQDEVSAGDAFDRAGVLAMANLGQPNSGSAQFFITTGAVRSLDGVHTIFGSCDGEAVVRRIESRIVAGEAGKPVLQSVRIKRR